MPSSDALLDLFRKSGALLDGHFRLTSGLHSTGYLQCALVLQHPAQAEALGRAIAERVADLKPTVVLSPALGGIVIGHEVATGLGVRALFAERQDGALMLRRGFILAETDRVLVVEDVVTTGGSTRETMQVAHGGGRTRRRRRVDRRSRRGRLARRPVSIAGLAHAAHLRTGTLPLVRAGTAGREAGVQARRVSRTFKLTIAYDGSEFVGWQRQASGVSIQGLLEDALSELDGRAVTVIGAGRTDAGVHARGQVASGGARTRHRRRGAWCAP